MKKFFAVTAPLCLILMAGCGKPQMPLGEVHGRLTLDGQPVVNAKIWFEPVAGGRSSFGESDHAGYYAMRYNARRMGALPGEHIVKMSTFQEALDPDEGSGDGATPMENIPGRAEEIPVKYRKSPLRVTVKRGSNTIDVTLDSKQ